jgi:hypothetical protein
MKMTLKYLAVFLVFGAALFIAANAANAAAAIPVIEWKCDSCGDYYFTFDPDNIGMNVKSEHKDGKFQNANWFYYFEHGKPIQKCSKDPWKEGAHFFVKSKDGSMSPQMIRDRKLQFIVLKSGGSTLKVKIVEWRCFLVGCNARGYCFDGDQLDYTTSGSFKPDLALKIFRMFGSGEQLSNCSVGARFFTGGARVLGVRHSIGGKDPESITSFSLASKSNNLWYSK